MNILQILTISLCGGAVFYPLTSHALEPLNFSIPLSKASLHRLSTYVGGHDIARVDLNGDGADEYILRDKACHTQSKDALCAFTAIARSDQDVRVLGLFNAHTLALSDQRTHGIRNILAYQTPSNDYAHTLYVWDAEIAQYREDAVK